MPNTCVCTWSVVFAQGQITCEQSSEQSVDSYFFRPRGDVNPAVGDEWGHELREVSQRVACRIHVRIPKLTCYVRGVEGIQRTWNGWVVLSVTARRHRRPQNATAGSFAIC